MSLPTILRYNWNYFQQQFSALLHNTSPVITLICVVTTIGYLLSFSKTAVLFLTVTPGYILPNSEFWIWTAFTFCFIELHFWEVFVDVITVGLCGKMLEPLWGQFEMFKFFAITNLGVSILTTIYYLFYYMVTKNPTILFDVHIHGLAGYVAGISVAVRQIMPEHLIFKTRYGRWTNRNVPLTVLVMSIILWALRLLDATFPAMFASGLLVSWAYLRFYQFHTNGRGDSSESFTFASFFPNVMQPIIAILVNPIYLCCLKVGVVKQPAPQRSISSSGLTSVTVSMPGVDPHDIERRKQIALKALTERLKAADLSRNNQLPKSFPTVSNHQHHQHHHGQHGHSHHHGHGQHKQKTTAAFINPGGIDSTALPVAPITSARSEPRMISTMSPIAIPMPAPPPKDVDGTAAVATTEQVDVSDNNELLIDMDNGASSSSRPTSH